MFPLSNLGLSGLQDKWALCFYLLIMAKSNTRFWVFFLLHTSPHGSQPATLQPSLSVWVHERVKEPPGPGRGLEHTWVLFRLSEGPGSMRDRCGPECPVVSRSRVTQGLGPHAPPLSLSRGEKVPSLIFPSALLLCKLCSSATVYMSSFLPFQMYKYFVFNWRWFFKNSCFIT